MKCEKCNHEQTAGKFCGKCGNALTAQTATNAESAFQQITQPQPVNVGQSTVPTYQTPVDPNLHVEKVKETSKQYWSYFLEYLKNPSLVLLNHEKQFVNALITFAIFALITALSVNDIIGYFATSFGDYGFSSVEESLKPSFLKILFYTALTLAVVFALSIGSLFAVSKLFGPQTHFKSLISMYGAYLVPMSLVMLADFLLLLIDSRGIGSLFLILGLFFSIFIMPLFLVATNINQQPKQIDSFYGYAAYAVLFALGLYIVLSIFVDSTISEMLTGIYELYDYSRF